MFMRGVYMMTLKVASERGSTKLAWLDSRHSFPFEETPEPDLDGFRALEALNDIRMAPGSSFPMRRRKDMEIVNYVVEGELRHQDSLGHSLVLSANDVQRLSAGLGMALAETNNSKVVPLRFLQLWIQPSCAGLKPGYEQMGFAKAERAGKLKLIASGDREEDCLFIHQDVHIYAAALSAGDSVRHIVSSNRNAWIQVISGAARLDGIRLSDGDAISISEEERTVDIVTDSSCELILLDLC